MIGKVIMFSGVVFTCGYAWHRYTRFRDEERRRQYDTSEAQRQQLEECIAGVWSEPRQLIADIQRGLAGPGEAASQSTAGRVVEVSLTPQAQRNAWQAATYLSTEGLTEDRDAAIKQVLVATAPGCDWSQGYLPYVQDARFRDVWESAGAILDLAELSHKYAPRSSATQGNGTLVNPGWIHHNPAPSADLQAGDYIEVLLDRFSPDPNDDSRYAEWAWIRIDQATGELVTGCITHEAPPGAQANALRNTESHGFGPGSPLSIPRESIHRVVHGR